jgi:hypothetical protein
MNEKPIVMEPEDEINRLRSERDALRNALELAEATINRLHRHAPGSATGTLDVIRAALKGGGK